MEMNWFKTKKKETKPSYCDVCNKQIRPPVYLSPPGLVMDLENKKVYVICEVCQTALGLHHDSNNTGFLMSGIKDGKEYVDIERVREKIRQYDEDYKI